MKRENAEKLAEKIVDHLMELGEKRFTGRCVVEFGIRDGGLASAVMQPDVKIDLLSCRKNQLLII